MIDMKKSFNFFRGHFILWKCLFVLFFVHEKNTQYLVIESLFSAGALKAVRKLQAKKNMRNNLTVAFY